MLGRQASARTIWVTALLGARLTGRRLRRLRFLRARAAVFVAVYRWAKNATQASACSPAIRNCRQWCLRPAGVGIGNDMR